MSIVTYVISYPWVVENFFELKVTNNNNNDQTYIEEKS